jgi:hypothetical protein
MREDKFFIVMHEHVSWLITWRVIESAQARIHLRSVTQRRER